MAAFPLAIRWEVRFLGNTMQRIVLKAYARGNPKASDFELQEVDIPQAGEREILVKTLWLALDPLCRFAIDEVRLSGARGLWAEPLRR